MNRQCIKLHIATGLVVAFGVLLCVLAGVSTRSIAAREATLADQTSMGKVQQSVTATKLAITPTVSFSSTNPLTVTEASTMITVAVVLDQPALVTTTVEYSSTNDTALADSDYLTATGTLTFTPGVTQQPITVTLLNDTQAESIEQFRLLLNPNSPSMTDTAELVIVVRDDDVPTIVFTPTSPLTLTEGTGTFSVGVLLDAAPQVSATLHYSSTNGTALAGADYVPLTGTLTFTAATTIQFIPVSIISDTLDEAREYFNIQVVDYVVDGTTIEADAYNRASRTLEIAITDDDPTVLHLPLILGEEPLSPPPGPTACNDIEENDVFADAKPFFTMTGQLELTCFGSLADDPQGEDDYYFIDLAANQTIAISLTTLPINGDYDLLLYYESIDGLVVNSSTTGSFDESIEYTVPSGKVGRYFIRLYMFKKDPNEAANTYKLRVAIQQATAGGANTATVILSAAENLSSR